MLGDGGVKVGSGTLTAGDSLAEVVIIELLRVSGLVLHECSIFV